MYSRKVARLAAFLCDYVGITRSKECCVLCTSSKRHNGSMQTVDADKSEFLQINGLSSLRASSEV